MAIPSQIMATTSHRGAPIVPQPFLRNAPRRTPSRPDQLGVTPLQTGALGEAVAARSSAKV
jgi:hypothetical protein